MGKTLHRFAGDIAPSKRDILENEDRLQKKHRRTFSDMLSEDDDFQNFKMFDDNDTELDAETAALYLKKD